MHAEEEESCVVLGTGLGGLTYQPVQQLAKITNFEYRYFFTVVNIVVVVQNLFVCSFLSSLPNRHLWSGCKWVKCLGG